MEDGQFDDSFDPLVYLDFYCSEEREIHEFLLDRLHEFFSRIEGSDLKLLDYGSGPTISHHISSTSKANEIILAEYAKPNRDFVEKWLVDPSTYDWSLHFKRVVCKREKRPEQDIIKREYEVRSKIKAIVPCDITKETFIAKGFEGPYDIVVSFLCLENVAASTDEYQMYLERLLSLVSDNGYFILFKFTRERTCIGYYQFGGKKYRCLYVTDMFLFSILQSAGLTDISIQHLTEASCITKEDKLSFITARKASTCTA